MKDKHYIWKDVLKNGKLVKQRFYIKNREDVIKTSEHPFGKDSYLSATLKEKLAYGFFYNDIFYSSTGERIQLTDIQYQEAIKKYKDPTVLYKGSDDYKKILKKQRKKFLALLPTIELKDKLFLKEVDRKQKQLNSLNTLEIRLNALKNLEYKILPTSTIHDIEIICSDIRNMMSDTNFKILIERNNKETVLDFNTFVESISKHIDKKYQPAILNFKILNIENFNIGMFKQIKQHLIYSDIYKKVNKQIDKMNVNENLSLPNLKQSLAEAAQKAYDEWEQDEKGFDEMLGTGGICQDIAEYMTNVLSGYGIECSTVSQQSGEQHVYVVAKIEEDSDILEQEGVYIFDISPYTYETGGGYNWKKIPDVKFDESDIIINRLDFDPNSFETYLDF